MRLFKYALDVLKNHEKELDKLTERLGKKKDQLSTNLQIFNSALDKLEAQLSCVETRINQTNARVGVEAFRPAIELAQALKVFQV